MGINSSSQNLVKVTIAPMLIKAVGTCSSFILSVFLARLLGISEFGMYSLVISVVTVIAIPVCSGIPTFVIREASKAISDERRDIIHRLLSWTNGVVFGYTLVAFTSIIVIQLLSQPSDFLKGLLCIILAVGTMALTLRNGAVLRAFKNFGRGTAPDILIRPTVQLALLMLLIVSIRPENFSVQVALATFLFATITAFACSRKWLKQKLSSYESTVFGSNLDKGLWLKPVIFLTIAGGGQVLFGHLDSIMLGIFGEPEEVGGYRASVQISMLLIFVLTVVNQVLQPSLAQLYHSKDFDGMQRLVANSSFYMFLMTLVAGSVLGLLAESILSLTFGASFSVGSLTLQILVIAQIFNVMFGSVGTLLNMTGMEKEAVISIVAAIILNLILDLILIPMYGMNGAASASCASICFWNILSRYFVKSRIGIESSGILHKAKQLIFSKDM